MPPRLPQAVDNCVDGGCVTQDGAGHVGDLGDDRGDREHGAPEAGGDGLTPSAEPVGKSVDDVDSTPSEVRREGIDRSQLWRSAVESIGSEVGPAVQAFLTQTRPVTMVGSTVVAVTDSEYAKTQLERRALGFLVTALSRQLDRTVGIVVEVVSGAAAPASTVESSCASEVSASAASTAATTSPQVHVRNA